jgi:amino acid transporter
MATPQTGTATVPAEATRRLTGSLGVGSIVFMVVAAASPLTVIGGAAPLGILLGNGAGYPSMYATAAVILLLFSVGLSAMSRVVPKPGAFFTYVGYGLGRKNGLGAAYLALLTYTTVQVAVYGYLGFSLNLALTNLGAPEIPWWAYSLAMIAFVGLLGYRHIDLSSKVLGVLLVAEIGIVLVLAAVVMATGGAEGLSAAPFTPDNMFSGAPGVGLMMAIAGFIGFEATAIFRDEAQDPEKTIPRATYAAVIVIGLFYTFAGWALVMAWGPSKVVDAAAADPGAMVVVTASNYLGTAGAVAVNFLLLTSLFACVLSFHNVISRYQHSMASAGTLPDTLANVHPQHLSPHKSSLVQTVTAGVLTALFAVLGMDPVLQVFTWLAGISTLAIVVLMAMTCLAVMVYFGRNRDLAGSAWKTRTAPVLALIGLVGACVLIVAYYPTLVGGGWGLSIALMATIPLAMAFGLVQGRYLERKNPDAYARISDAISG